MAVLKPFLTAVIGAAISLQLLILANMSYLYGTAYRDGSRFSAMKMLFVDYDGGAVGQSVALAYEQMRGPGFPSLLERSQEQYPTEQDIQEAVCRGDYWGVIYSDRNASSRLAGALSSSERAQAYDSSRALGYVYNSAKYPAYAQIVSSDLAQLAQAAASVYAQTSLTAALGTINVSDPDIAQTVRDPISSTSTDIHPMNQGVRFYYNTVSMVMPIIIQFFFIMAINGISTQTYVYNTFSPGQNTILRFVVSVCYTFIAALVMTGYIWAFRENWDVSSGQFALTWMAIWLAMHVHFLFIDFVTSVLPMPFVPFFVLTWVITNVASTIGPFELSPGFYRIGYAFPAHSLYELLLDIWTEGCNPHLYRTLPILWCEWIVVLVLFVIGMKQRTKASFETSLSEESSKA
ncbi:SNG1 family protein [Aspergillus stella-maris]|uniref:SNG1 family protein n=1 Tax=Aspergillus stella-maris TaxID=1810926 RepID=UPI003CCCD1DA